jgi:hypothetical protein
VRKRLIRLDFLHNVEDARRIAVCSVDHEDVDASIAQRTRTLPRVTEEPDRRSYAKSTFVVLRRVRIQLTLLEIFDRDEPDQFARVIDKGEFLNLVLGEQRDGIVVAD